MSYKNIIVVCCALLFGMAGCAVTDIDRTADFSKYKTFAWGKSEVKVENPSHKSDLINKNIQSTVEQEFAKRGIVLDKKDPDFVVSYHTYTENKEETSGNYLYGYPFAFGSFYRFAPFGFYNPYMPYMHGTYPRTHTYTEGTLIIDITDKRSNELVWRGEVSGRVGNTGNLQKQIAKGIKAIMKKYPVSPQEPLPVDKKVIS
jgi:hypothetical protein